MSALSRINGSRSLPSASGIGYDTLRDKVAALVRPEKAASMATMPLQMRPMQDDSTLNPKIKSEHIEAVGRDLGSAVDILGRATTCFDLLTQKLEQVEGERDEAAAQVEEHKRAAASWQEMIDTVQARMRDAERDLSNMRQEMTSQNERANAAEQRAAQLESTLRLRERRLAELESTYSSLHDQVMASFGLQSPTYRALEALVEKFQAKAA